MCLNGYFESSGECLSKKIKKILKDAIKIVLLVKSLPQTAHLAILKEIKLNNFLTSLTKANVFAKLDFMKL